MYIDIINYMWPDRFSKSIFTGLGFITFTVKEVLYFLKRLTIKYKNEVSVSLKNCFWEHTLFAPLEIIFIIFSFHYVGCQLVLYASSILWGLFKNWRKCREFFKFLKLSLLSEKQILKNMFFLICLCIYWMIFLSQKF